MHEIYRIQFCKVIPVILICDQKRSPTFAKWVCEWKCISIYCCFLYFLINWYLRTVLRVYTIYFWITEFSFMTIVIQWMNGEMIVIFCLWIWILAMKFDFVIIETWCDSVTPDYCNLLRYLVYTVMGFNIFNNSH